MMNTDKDEIFSIEFDASPAVDVAKRTISGPVLPANEIGSTGAGPTRVDAAGVFWSDQTRRVKLLREHDKLDAVGKAIEIEAAAGTISAVFHVPEGTNGDRALREAADGIRDGFSVGLYNVEGERGPDGVYEVKKAQLREVSLVSIPAFDGARVTNVNAAAAAEKEKNMTEKNTMEAEEQKNTAPEGELATLTASVNDLAGIVKGLVASKSNENGTQVKAGALAGENGKSDVSLDEVTTILLKAKEEDRLRTVKADIEAALSDVASTDAASLAWKPAYQTELLGMVPYVRSFINNAVTTAPFPNALKIVYPKWDTEPEVGSYSGDKAAVASASVAMSDTEFAVERWAVAHDIDRAFFDLGDSAYIQAFLAARFQSYQRKTNDNAISKAVAGATVLNGGADYSALLTGMKDGAKSLLAAGYQPQYVAVSVDLIDALWDITSSGAPAWFNGSVSLADGTGDVSGIKMFCDPGMAAGHFLVGSRAGVRFHENAPIEITAVDVANGGIDLGLMGYTFTYVADDNALAVGTVA